MNVYRICVVIIIILGGLTCTKHHLNSNGFWILGPTQYEIINTQRETSNYFIFSGIDSKSPMNILHVYFTKIPTNNGKFDVVAFNDDVQLLQNQVGIRATIPSKGVYSSTGIASNQTWLTAEPVEVTISDGKLRMEIPTMTTRIATSTFIDTLFLKGIISEY